MFINNQIIEFIVRSTRPTSHLWSRKMNSEDKIIYEDIEFYKIKDFPDYYISKCGKVLSLMGNKHKEQKNKIKSIRKDIGNYLIVDLMNNNIKYTKKVHRLVAQQFIPNLENKRTVNHKDGNKLNNNVDNLEWMTHSENHYHAYKNKIREGVWKNKFGKFNGTSKKVNQYNLEGEFIRTWDSMADVQRELNLDKSSICACCRRKQKTAFGFIWGYTNE